MKLTEIKELSIADIQEKIGLESTSLIQMELTHTTSPLENPMKIRQTRRTIARLKTILSQKQQIEK